MLGVFLFLADFTSHFFIFFASSNRCCRDLHYLFTKVREWKWVRPLAIAGFVRQENKQKIFFYMEDIILAKLEAIERNSLLAAKNVLTIDDVAVLTGMSKSHLYKLTCSRQIPFYRPNGKLVYFDRQELEGWLKQNRVTTQEEAEQQAIAYVMTHKK